MSTLPSSCSSPPCCSTTRPSTWTRTVTSESTIGGGPVVSEHELHHLQVLVVAHLQVGLRAETDHQRMLQDRKQGRELVSSCRCPDARSGYGDLPPVRLIRGVVPALGGGGGERRLQIVEGEVQLQFLLRRGGGDPRRLHARATRRWRPPPRRRRTVPPTGPPGTSTSSATLRQGEQVVDEHRMQLDPHLGLAGAVEAAPRSPGPRCSRPAAGRRPGALRRRCPRRTAGSGQQRHHAANSCRIRQYASCARRKLASRKNSSGPWAPSSSSPKEKPMVWIPSSSSSSPHTGMLPPEPECSGAHPVESLQHRRRRPVAGMVRRYQVGRAVHLARLGSSR